MKKKEREQKIEDAKKMIEHAIVDIKYIPKDAMKYPGVKESLDNMLETIDALIRKLKSKRKKNV